MATTMARQQQRRATAARWAELNPVLLEAEFGYDKTNKRVKMGDGVTPWNDLPYTDQAETATEAEAGAVAARDDAVQAATDAVAARDEAQAFVAPVSQTWAPAVGVDGPHVVTGDDLTVQRLDPTGGSGIVFNAAGSRVLCTVTAVVEPHVDGVLIGAARKDGGVLVVTDDSMQLVRGVLGGPSAVTVQVELEVVAGNPVEVVPVMAAPYGESWVRVGRIVFVGGVGTDPIDYGPLTLTTSQLV